MGKVKNNDVNLDEIDANFIISSIKNKERRNNPGSEPKPLLPKNEEKAPESEMIEETKQSGQPREENKRKRNKTPDYESLFIQEVEITARTGKAVYIRNEHHEKIMKIVRVIGQNRLSLFSYIDNVLSHHLTTYQDEITELYNENNKGIF